ncbi:MAG: CBS domain-containing protein [Rubripirellula sp.]
MVSVREMFDGETVGVLPLRKAITVESGTIVRAAVARMRASDLGCAVIVGFRGKPVGMFTERSLLDVLLENASLDESPVGEFCEFQCSVVQQNDPISRVWDAIEQDGERFVCVTNEHGELVGITGQRGLAEYISETFPREVVVQRIGGKPWMKQKEGA